MSIKLALGVPGAGKTLALQDMARDAVAQGWCVFTVCRANEWTVEGNNPRWRGRPPPAYDVEGLPLWSPGEPVEFEGFEDLCALRDEGGCLVRFPYPWESVAVAELAAAIGDVVIIDDEIDLVARRKGWEDNPWRAFVHRGRHLPDVDGVPREVHVYGAARRPQNLHTDLTELADEVLLFRLQGSNTLGRVFDEGWVPEAQLEELSRLPDLDYFLWRSSGLTARGRLQGL